MEASRPGLVTALIPPTILVTYTVHCLYSSPLSNKWGTEGKVPYFLLFLQTVKNNVI